MIWVYVIKLSNRQHRNGRGTEVPLEAVGLVNTGRRCVILSGYKVPSCPHFDLSSLQGELGSTAIPMSQTVRNVFPGEIHLVLNTVTTESILANKLRLT